MEIWSIETWPAQQIPASSLQGAVIKTSTNACDAVNLQPASFTGLDCHGVNDSLVTKEPYVWQFFLSRPYLKMFARYKLQEIWFQHSIAGLPQENLLNCEWLVVHGHGAGSIALALCFSFSRSCLCSVRSTPQSFEGHHDSRKQSSSFVWTLLFQITLESLRMHMRTVSPYSLSANSSHSNLERVSCSSERLAADSCI